MSVPPRPHPLAGALLEHLERSRLLTSGQPVLVALSGGLDSVVLLHLLRFALPALRLRLTAAHFDHRMRPDSEQEAAWVRGLCRAWRVPLVQGVAAVPLRGEAAARSARYRFLAAAAADRAVSAVLTAHQQDDQAETVLFRIARGTGLRGLAGIAARRGLLVRPLLPFRRRQLLAYARARRLGWREDPSNRSRQYARNRVRLDVLPAMESVWPEAVPRLAGLAAAAAAVEALWAGLLPELAGTVVVGRPAGGYELARGRLLEYHAQTRARVMRYLLRQLGSTPGRAGTRAATEFISSGDSGTGIALQGGVRVEREFDRILICRPADPGTGTADRPIHILAPDAGSARGRVGGLPVAVRWGPDGGTGGGYRATFDPAALRFPLVLRSWEPGDRITLGYGTKKLKKLLAERRVGRSARRRIRVLAEQEGVGRVLWVVGVARTAEVAERGGEVWQITVEHGESG